MYKYLSCLRRLRLCLLSILITATAPAQELPHFSGSVLHCAGAAEDIEIKILQDLHWDGTSSFVGKLKNLHKIEQGIEHIIVHVTETKSSCEETWTLSMDDSTGHHYTYTNVSAKSCGKSRITAEQSYFLPLENDQYRKITVPMQCTLKFPTVRSSPSRGRRIDD